MENFFEFDESDEFEVENKELKVIKYNGINVTDSREVAAMIGKRHDNLVRDIDGYVSILNQTSTLRTDNFFIVSSYSAGTGKKYKCYLLTKQGCEMVANKMIGEKGVLFTAEYVQAFNKMETQIKQLSPMDQLRLQYQVIEQHENKLTKLDNKVDALESNMPLFNVECKEVQALVRKTGIRILGGYHSNAYKDNSLRGKVYADIQHELKREFGVSRYEAIKRHQLNKAHEIISNYKAPIVLEDQITLLNRQTNI